MDHTERTERETEGVSSVDGGVQETTDIEPVARAAHTLHVMVVV